METLLFMSIFPIASIFPSNIIVNRHSSSLEGIIGHTYFVFVSVALNQYNRYNQCLHTWLVWHASWPLACLCCVDSGAYRHRATYLRPWDLAAGWEQQYHRISEWTVRLCLKMIRQKWYTYVIQRAWYKAPWYMDGKAIGWDMMISSAEDSRARAWRQVTNNCWKSAVHIAMKDCGARGWFYKSFIVRRSWTYGDMLQKMCDFLEMRACGFKTVRETPSQFQGRKDRKRCDWLT